jgi:hypothetical protein
MNPMAFETKILIWKTLKKNQEGRGEPHGPNEHFNRFVKTCQFCITDGGTLNNKRLALFALTPKDSKKKNTM